jgi:hypothetical protein
MNGKTSFSTCNVPLICLDSEISYLMFLYSYIYLVTTAARIAAAFAIVTFAAATATTAAA